MVTPVAQVPLIQIGILWSLSAAQQSLFLKNGSKTQKYSSHRVRKSEPESEIDSNGLLLCCTCQADVLSQHHAVAGIGQPAAALRRLHQLRSQRDHLGRQQRVQAAKANARALVVSPRYISKVHPEFEKSSQFREFLR